MINYIWNLICNIFNTKKNITNQEISTIESDISNIQELIGIYEKHNIELFTMNGDYIKMKDNFQKLINEINSKKFSLKAIEDDIKGQEYLIDNIYNEKIKDNIPKLKEYKKKLETLNPTENTENLLQKLNMIIHYCSM